MNKSISSLLNEVKIATQDYVAAKVRAGQLTDAETGIEMLKALESPISIAERLSVTSPGRGKIGLSDSDAGVIATPSDNVVANPPYKKNPIRRLNCSYADEPPFYFIYKDKLYKVGKLNGQNKKPYYKKMVPVEELPYLLDTLKILLTHGNGKVAVKDYLEKIKMEAPNSYGRKISEYRCYVVVGALEKAGILEQKERGKYCYAVEHTPSANEIMDALHALDERRDLLILAE